MSLSYRVGAGHQHSTLDSRLRTMGAANVVTRLTTQAFTGRALPMEVHQHYGLEFHLLLTDTCIHRVYDTAGACDVSVRSSNADWWDSAPASLTRTL